MAKLVYVYGDDSKLLETLVTSLRSSGYSLEYTELAKEFPASGLKADIVLNCKPEMPLDVQTYGGLTIDFSKKTVLDQNHEEIHLTPTEYSLLTYLVKNSSRAIPRSELLPRVWGYDNNSHTRVADDIVKRLRKKLENSHVTIETIWGYGFKTLETND